MYGKNVEVKFGVGNEIVCNVFVFCKPDTPEDELQKRALKIIKRESKIALETR